MNTASEGPGQNCDDTAENAPEVTAAGSRRLLLGGVVGGFALAASGLLLPTTDEEAEAREGRNGGTLGGRRGKNYRGRHKQRSHGDKKDKDRDKAPKLRPFRRTALDVLNYSHTTPLHCTFYYQAFDPNDDGIYLPPVADGERTLATQHHYRYDPDRYRVGVLIRLPEEEDGFSLEFYVDVRNVTVWYPRGGVTFGRHLDPPSGNIGTTYIEEQNFAVGDQKRKQAITLERVADDSWGTKRIEFRLKFDDGK